MAGDRMVREGVRKAIRSGLEEFDREIGHLVERYRRGELDLDEYLDFRAALERGKESRVLENLRGMRRRGYSPNSGTLPR